MGKVGGNKIMENNKLIANALLEIAKRSQTTFLEVGKEDKELIEAAKKLGIELPSPDLMVMKTIYAEIDKVNLNGVILPRKAVEEGLNTLVGKQCNWEHDGAGFVCGYTISAKINEDKIETINVLFKSLFIDQAEELKEKVKSGEAAVSFEIWNKNPDSGKSVVKELANGFKEINPIIFHGTGVLLTHQPACPKAKIFKLIAKKEINEAEKIVDKVFSEVLSFASLAIEEPKCVNCGKCNCGKEVKVVTKQIKSEEWICPHCEKVIGEKELFLDEKTNKWYHRPCQEKGEIILPKETAKEKEEKVMIKCEKCGTEFESSVEEKICSKCIELATEANPAETKPVDAGAETKPVETPVEKTKEVAQPLEVIEPKVVVKVTSIYSEVRIDTYVDGTPSGTSEVKGYNKRITEYKDGTKDEVEEVVEIKKKYDFAELEEAVNKAKEELTNLHKAELEAKTNEVKTDLEQKIGEKETEISNLKKELDAKAQEIAELKTTKAKVEDEQPELNVGNVEDTEVETETQKQAKEINKIIAKKHEKK